MTDPNGYLFSNDYNALHDPHLKPFLDNSNMRQYLYNRGLIDKEDRVICTLKEFNEYLGNMNYFYLTVEKQQQVSTVKPFTV